MTLLLRLGPQNLLVNWKALEEVIPQEMPHMLRPRGRKLVVPRLALKLGQWCWWARLHWGFSSWPHWVAAPTQTVLRITSLIKILSQTAGIRNALALPGRLHGEG